MPKLTSIQHLLYFFWGILYFCSISILVNCTYSAPLSASAHENIAFFDGTFEQALQKAGNEQKYLFVHTTSGHCSSCQSLAHVLFADSSVAHFYNDNFLNYELDVDNSDYVNFTRIHELGSHPVMLYFNPKGYMIKRQAGIETADELVNAGKYALNYNLRDEESYANLENMKNKYKHGYKEPQFLYDLAYMLKIFGESYNTIVNQYLETQTISDFKKEPNRKFIYDFSDNLENNAIDYFLNDLYHYKEVVGGRQINEKIKMAIYNTVITAIKERDKKLFDKVQEVIGQAHIPNREAFAFYIKSEFFEGIKDWEKFAKVTIKYFNEYNITDPYLLNHASNKFYLFITNKGQLRQATKWVKKSIKIENEYYNNLTLANVYNKLDKCKLAIETAEKAIDIAEIRGNIDDGDAARLVDNLTSRGCN